MEKERKTFDEQQAPRKNTDGAFVQVGKDGQPVIPHEEHTAENELHTTEKNEEESSD